MSMVDPGINLGGPPPFTPVTPPTWGSHPSTPTPPTGTPEQNDAFATLKDLLTQYGLGSLADWAWGQLLNNRSPNEILLSLYDQPEFKDRFPVIDARRQAGLPAMSVAQVLQYENSWNQIAVAAGLPLSFRDRNVAQEAMIANVSLSEMQDRVQKGYVRVHEDPTLRDTFRSYFGPQGDQALAALFIDPERALPDLERMVATAAIGAEGARSGIGIDQSTATGLAEQGVTQDQARSGLAQVAQLQPLFHESISEHSDLQAGREGVAAVLGADSNAAREIQRRADQRRADYSGSSNALIDQTGAVGLGSAPRR